MAPIKIIFMAGKGGVGKSAVASSVARILARDHKVAIIDADLEGSNLQTVFGVPDEELKVDVDGSKVLPMQVNDNLDLVTISAHPAIRKSRSAVMWEPETQRDFLKQVLTKMAWSFKPEFLIIDCPAGVGAIFPALKSIYKHIDGAVLVTIPAKVSVQNCEAVVILLRNNKVPVLGLLANMSYKICPECGHKDYLYGRGHIKPLVLKHNIHEFGELPFDGALPMMMDRGEAINHDVFVDISDKIILLSKPLNRIKRALGWGGSDGHS